MVVGLLLPPPPLPHLDFGFHRHLLLHLDFGIHAYVARILEMLHKPLRMAEFELDRLARDPFEGSMTLGCLEFL